MTHRTITLVILALAAAAGAGLGCAKPAAAPDRAKSALAESKDARKPHQTPEEYFLNIPSL